MKTRFYTDCVWGWCSAVSLQPQGSKFNRKFQRPEIKVNMEREYRHECFKHSYATSDVNIVPQYNTVQYNTIRATSIASLSRCFQDVGIILRDYPSRSSHKLEMNDVTIGLWQKRKKLEPSRQSCKDFRNTDTSFSWFLRTFCYVTTSTSSCSWARSCLWCFTLFLVLFSLTRANLGQIERDVRLMAPPYIKINNVYILACGMNQGRSHGCTAHQA